MFPCKIDKGIRDNNCAENILNVKYSTTDHIPQFIRVLGGSNDSQPVTKIIFFQIFLRKVFEISRTGNKRWEI